MNEKVEKFKIDESIAWIQRFVGHLGTIHLVEMASDPIRYDAVVVLPPANFSATMKLRILPESQRNRIGLLLC